MSILVFAEQKNGGVVASAFEAIGAARKLADKLGGQVWAALVGQGVEGAASSLTAAGADKVFLFDHPFLQTFRDDPVTDLLANLIREETPEIVLFPGTAVGRSLAPRLAARLRVGLAADCTDLRLEDGRLKAVRPVMGGNLLSEIAFSRKPQMATLRPKAFPKPEVRTGRNGEIVRKDFDPATLKDRTKILDVVQEITETVKLEEADIIISGGRGLGGAEGFGILRDLAKVLGAAVGASRAAVDAGWIPYSLQVGQTGKTVSPNVYIACGISGAIQHLAGMQSAKVIVAINKNPDAPIFQVATYGIVGDLFQVVPALTAELKKALA